MVKVQARLSPPFSGRVSADRSGKGCIAGDSPVAGRSAGYALVDALVALLILSMALIFSLQATQQARRAADQAWEVRRAHTMLAHLMDLGPQGPDDAQGVSDGFAWKIETRITGAEQPIAICRRGVALTAERSRRAYEASTLQTCPQEAVG